MTLADSVSVRRETRSPSVGGRARLRIGDVWIDAVTLSEALQAIERLVASRRGGAVFTPNVDHLVKASSHAAFRDAYSRVTLSLTDGMPLVWVSRLLGCRLPERVAGSDLLLPLLQLAARRGWSVYLLGGAPGVAEAAAKMLACEMGIAVAGWNDARIEPDGSDRTGESIARVRAASADLILVALGPPKQELWIDRAREAGVHGVALGVGASLDFLVGKYRRAPRWMARIGLEWLFRLVQEPRRLWRRYLLEGPRFFGICVRTWLAPRESRVQEP
jgi:N-acetylglucosaminyldiphosphoundecaprenol N-acetyl-beta-D-mannosaminyltransferase